MVREINLLPKRNQNFLQQERTVIAARSVAILSLVIVMCSLIGLFLLGKNYSVESVQGQQQNVRSRLSLLQNKALQQLTLINRVNQIQQIVKKRISLTDKINAMQKLVPQNATIDTLQVSDDAVSISVSSASLPAMQKFLDSLTTLVSQKKLVKKITINNVVLNQKTGLYNVSVEGTFL